MTLVLFGEEHGLLIKAGLSTDFDSRLKIVRKFVVGRAARGRTRGRGGRLNEGF